MESMDPNTHSKYEAALGHYNLEIDEKDISLKVKDLIEKKFKENDTIAVKKTLFNCIDLTSLKCIDSEESIMKFTEKVNQFDDQFPHLKNVAAICVYPKFASIVKNTLEVDDINIACVAGGFPSSQTFIEVKVAETAMAIMEGADEIDVAIPTGEYLSGNYEDMCDELVEIKETCKDHKLKVILETGILKSSKDIKKAAILAMYSGADFIKTSTGKEAVGATPEAAYIMCQTIKEYYKLTGRKVGFKPAGGINTTKEALIYYTIVKEILGDEWLTNTLFRIGTSKLANLLLSEIEEENITFF